MHDWACLHCSHLILKVSLTQLYEKQFASAKRAFKNCLKCQEEEEEREKQDTTENISLLIISVKHLYSRVICTRGQHDLCLFVFCFFKIIIKAWKWNYIFFPFCFKFLLTEFTSVILTSSTSTVRENSSELVENSQGELK